MSASRDPAAEQHTRANHHPAALEPNLKKTGAAAYSLLQDFKNFLNRGSVVDLAVGVVMGAAFTAIVTSLVTDLVTPLVGLATEKNLANCFLVLRCANTTAASACKKGSAHGYNTTAQAKADGAATWNWGSFVEAVVNFLVIAVIVFFIVKAYAATFLRFKKKEEPKTKPCPACCEPVNVKARKCKCCQTVFEVPEPLAKPAPAVARPGMQHGFALQNPFQMERKR
ncbi:large-conductance mechanosensitive channel [Zopfochytrium polystomum]|nr:large-conductance mechanosensitive channel [Zopfochytrium polystomum]